jgi:hypothetical protein
MASTERHYNQARAVEAAARWQAALLALRDGGTALSGESEEPAA